MALPKEIRRVPAEIAAVNAAIGRSTGLSFRPTEGNTLGGAAAESRHPEPNRWRKSRRSADNGACVELAALEQDIRGLRDSKNPNGSILRVSPKTLKIFLKSIKSGKFGH